jgi:hypothetical protein
MDLQNRVRKIVGDAGEVVSKYGGYEITVVRPDLLPWHEVFDLLIETGQDVWITRKHGKTSINTEPKAE